jgi:hypothetical protein
MSPNLITIFSCLKGRCCQREQAWSKLAEEQVDRQNISRIYAAAPQLLSQARHNLRDHRYSTERCLPLIAICVFSKILFMRSPPQPRRSDFRIPLLWLSGLGIVLMIRGQPECEF